jgi:hypothetical protein
MVLLISSWVGQAFIIFSLESGPVDATVVMN